MSKRSLGVIFLTVFIDLVGFSIIFPLFPAMLEWYQQTASDSGFVTTLFAWLQSLSGGEDPQFAATVLFGGLLGSLYSLLQFFSSTLWGRLSDRWGRRPVLLLTVAGTALSYLLWAFSGSFTLLVLSRALGGIMAGNLAVASAAIADVTDEENRTKGMALIGIAFGLGFMCGPALGGGLSMINPLDHFPQSANLGINPFSLPALGAFLLACLNLIWVNAVFRETRGASRSGQEETSESTEQASPPEAQNKPLDSRPTGFRTPNWLRLPRFEQRALVQSYLLFILAFAGMEFTLTFLAVERLGYSPRQMVAVFLFIGAILLIVQGGVVRRISGKGKDRNILLAGLFASAIGLVLLAVAHSQLPFYLGLLGISVGMGLAAPTFSGLISRYSDADTQGFALGVFRSVGALGRAVGPLAAALLYFSLGSMAAYYLGAAWIFLTLALSLRLPEPKLA